MKPPRISYRMPAEWEPHASTWLAWPHYRGDWPGKFEPIPWVYAEIIRHLGRHERIDLIVNNRASENQARKVLTQSERPKRKRRLPPLAHKSRLDPRLRLHLRRRHHAPVRSVSIPTAQSRDLVFASNLSAIKWRFNAWAKYPNYQHDEKIGSRMAEAAGVEEIRAVHGKSRVVLEGGSIDVNGQGTLLTTEECLLSKTQQRNRAMSRKDYEKLFSDYLGIRNVIWLGSGIAGDDTHGHVDDITRFVSPDTVVTAVESDPRRRKLRAAAGKHPPPARRHRSGRQAAGHRRTPHARPGRLRRPPPSRQLRQFLHRQRHRPGPGLQRPQRPRRARHPGRPLPRPRNRRHLFRRFNLGIRRAALHDATAAGRLVVSRQSSVVQLKPN